MQLRVDRSDADRRRQAGGPTQHPSVQGEAARGAAGLHQGLRRGHRVVPTQRIYRACLSHETERVPGDGHSRRGHGLAGNPSLQSGSRGDRHRGRGRG